MIAEKAKGYLYALLSSSFFGLIPLFTLPLMSNGMSTATILLYRFGFASILLWLWLTIIQMPIKVSRRQLAWSFLLGSIYFCTAFLLQLGYHHMSSGAATVLHFLYPIFTALLMFLFFKQKLGAIGQLAILMAIIGVALMSGIQSNDSSLSWLGVGLVLLSALGYAVYIIIVNKSSAGHLPPILLNCLVLSFATIYYISYALFSDNFRLPLNETEWFNAVMLALIPTVFSNLFLVKAIPLIGSTPTSVMGALEPTTAVIVGILVFHEPLTLTSLLGMILVLLAVLLLIRSRPTTH